MTTSTKRQMLITLGPITWIAVAAAVSSLSAVVASLFMFKRPQPKVWGADHDHEAEYQKLVTRLRG